MTMSSRHFDQKRPKSLLLLYVIVMDYICKCTKLWGSIKCEKAHFSVSIRLDEQRPKAQKEGANPSLRRMASRCLPPITGSSPGRLWHVGLRRVDLKCQDSRFLHKVEFPCSICGPAFSQLPPGDSLGPPLHHCGRGGASKSFPPKRYSRKGEQL